ncbi:uncharacterized protein EMH_0039490 [Eimeria mitis]|uniref:Uncharacterized protein n=1 Tax=Eimeria mitis TaxID=44415 RepID=U6JU22_9EIME|nr:uncharacterized protein EMH_0039490 [Eimeria mitis]CDJ28281.1 hypothetical protein, conserved [Eimeria mitis]
MAKQLGNPAEANGELGSNSHPAGSAELLHGGAGVTTEEESNLTREGQAADEDGVIPLEGKSFDWGSRRATLFSKSILKLLLLLAGLGVLMSSRYIGRTLVKTRFAFSPKSKREEVLVSAPVMPSVTMDDLVECEEQLISSFSGFVNTWRTASPIVQSAFKKYFVPSREDDPLPPPDPPALYDKHINAMLGVPRPNAEDVKAVQEHKLNLLLLNGVCGAASITIRKLMELEELHAETGVPVPMLGLGKPIDQEQLKGLMMQEKEGVTTAELLRNLGIVVKAEGETMRARWFTISK